MSRYRIGIVTVLLSGAMVLMLAASAGAATSRHENPATNSHVSQGTLHVLNGASDVTPQAGWLGPCYPAYGYNWGGGWCDGNGPNWNYRGYVDCSNGWRYFGILRWAGDRRGSYAYCPSGTYATGGGLYVYYL